MCKICFCNIKNSLLIFRHFMKCISHHVLAEQNGPSRLERRWRLCDSSALRWHRQLVNRSSGTAKAFTNTPDGQSSRHPRLYLGSSFASICSLRSGVFIHNFTNSQSLALRPTPIRLPAVALAREWHCAPRKRTAADDAPAGFLLVTTTLWRPVELESDSAFD